MVARRFGAGLEPRMMEPQGMRRLLVAEGAGASDRLRASLEALPHRERDGWFDAVLGIDAFPEGESDLPSNCVPYLPCAVDVLVRAVDGARLTNSDVFVDIGSGLGRAALFAHFLTGAAAIGIELQPALASKSRLLAAALNVTRFAAVEGDAAGLVKFIPIGTVFFLYCPFSGARLERVLDHLEDIARARPIRVCSVQLPALKRAWLELISGDEELSIYRSVA